MEVDGAESAQRQAGVTASLRHPPLITYLSSARLVSQHKSQPNAHSYNITYFHSWELRTLKPVDVFKIYFGGFLYFPRNLIREFSGCLLGSGSVYIRRQTPYGTFASNSILCSARCSSEWAIVEIVSSPPAPAAPCAYHPDKCPHLQANALMPLWNHYCVQNDLFCIQLYSYRRTFNGIIIIASYDIYFRGRWVKSQNLI